MSYEFDNGTSAVHDPAMRTIVQNEFKGPRFQGCEAQLVGKLFLDGISAPQPGVTESLTSMRY